jgi:hypothetical protein
VTSQVDIATTMDLVDTTLLEQVVLVHLVFHAQRMRMMIDWMMMMMMMMSDHKC